MRIVQIVVIGIALFSLQPTSASAQIYRWNTGELIPGTEEMTPGPGMNLNGWNQEEMGHHLRFADFSGGLSLANSFFTYSWMNSARFDNSNLDGVRFTQVDLTEASFSNANISNATFDSCTGFTASQFYSTINYQTNNFQGVSVVKHDMNGWNFANLNLRGLNLSGHMIGADFNGAFINEAFLGGFVGDPTSGLSSEQLCSTRSYQSKDLSKTHLAYCSLAGSDFSNQNFSDSSLYGSDLTGADFTGACLAGVVFPETVLRNANFRGADLSNAGLMYVDDFANADFTDAIITGARFFAANSIRLTQEQFYSTDSYKNLDLHAIGIASYDLAGWNFRHQKLTNADVRMSNNLNGTDFSCADLRGATFGYTGMGDSILDNTILQDGHIEIFDLDSEMYIRDYDGDIAITIEDVFLMSEDSKLQMFFADETWGSTISLYFFCNTNLDGTLYLGFEPDVDVESMIGVTFDLFNWNRALSDGDVFADVTWDEGFEWDISDLYDGGTVTLIAVPEPTVLLLLLSSSLVVLRKQRRTNNFHISKCINPKNCVLHLGYRVYCFR